MSFPIIRGKRLRATLLNDDGTPVASATPAAVVVTSGFITVSLSPVVESGDTFRKKNANGDFCVNERSPDQWSNDDVELTLCDVDPELVTLLTGQPLELDADSEPVGFRQREGSEERKVALEVWTGTGSGRSDYGYLLLPRVTGAQIGGLTIENGAADVTVKGYTESGQGWGVGPHDVVPDGTGAASPLGTAIVEGEHRLLRTTTIAPPAVTDGAVAMP